MSALCFHAASAVNFWTQMAQGVAAGDDVPLDRPGDDGLGPWLADTFDRLLPALAAVDPASPIGWSFTDDASAGFAQRRIVHELTVHGWDAANAAGIEDVIDPDVVLDGIDEYLEVWMASVFGDRTGAIQTVHLHATDTQGSAGEWHVSVGDDQLTVTHEHAKGDVAVRGPALDLLLLMWGRLPSDAPQLEVFGDPEDLATFLARVAA